MNNNHFSDDQRELFRYHSDEEFYHLIDEFNERAAKAIDEWSEQSSDNTCIVKKYFGLSDDETFSELIFDTETLFKFLNNHNIDVPLPYAVYVYYGNDRFDELAESWGEHEFVNKLSDLEKDNVISEQNAYAIAMSPWGIIIEGYLNSAMITKIKNLTTK